MIVIFKEILFNFVKNNIMFRNYYHWNDSRSLSEIQRFMGCGSCVTEWNQKRELAKGIFGRVLICELDASGYIKEYLYGAK